MKCRGRDRDTLFEWYQSCRYLSLLLEDQVTIYVSFIELQHRAEGYSELILVVALQ